MTDVDVSRLVSWLAVFHIVNVVFQLPESFNLDVSKKIRVIFKHKKKLLNQ